MSLKDIALRVAEEQKLRIDNACGCSECRERDEHKIIAFAEALIAALAKQTEKPVATVVISTTGMFAGIKRNLVLHQDAPLLFDGDKLYAEAQLLAEQQRTAEACANLMEAQHNWITREAASALIRNAEWRKYYE